MIFLAKLGLGVVGTIAVAGVYTFRDGVMRVDVDEARANGIREFVLLTTSARDFFARHFGFAEAERSQFNDAFANSPEWHLPRCLSAFCLTKRCY